MNQRGWTSQTFLMVTGILVSVVGVDGFLDFICFALQPRIDIDGDNDMRIGGYMGGVDKDASVSLGRTTNTGTSSGLALPDGSNERDHAIATVSARLLDMPDVGGVERIGAFFCNANKDGVDEKVTTIIMSSASTIRPRELSQTVSVGQQVTLSVDTDVDVTTLRWRHNGGDFISSLAGLITYTIENVNPTDAGVYECYEYNKRTSGVHAIFQLIVRGCPHRKWNLPSCDRDCPHCFNGGICDERSGQCVCAPGFSGIYCQTVHGRNKWGQDGKLRCAGSDDHTYGCQGKLFCLPHPYGCSCTAGFKGLDCGQECEIQMYGADCRQRCHCATGDCLKDTGECDSGQCEADWYGVNCQEYCPASAPEPITNLHVVSTSRDSVSVGWDHYDQCPGFTQYMVEYYLISLDNCMLVNQDGTTVSAPTKEYTISGLDYFSTYRVGVKAIRQLSQSATFFSASVSVNKNTDQTVPNAAPTTIEYVAESNSITVTWEEIPCGSRRGSGLLYDYRLKFTDDTIFMDWQNTTGTLAVFTELTECSQYTFEVRAVNDIGSGEIAYTTVNTETIAPGPVTSSQMLQVSSSSLSVTWAKSEANNCREDSYFIQYRSINIDQCNAEEGEWVSMTTTDTIVTLPNLLPYSTYEVSITPVLSNANGETIMLTGMTLISIPSGPPESIVATEIKSNEITIKWKPPKCGERHGELIAYSYILTESYGETVQRANTTATSLQLGGLKPFTNHTFSIAAITGTGSGPYFELVVTTKKAVLEAPTNVRFTNISKYAMTVMWSEPFNSVGLVTGYSVLFFVSAKPYDLFFLPISQFVAQHFVNENEPLSFTFSKLLPSTEYLVRITAYAHFGHGDEAVGVQFTQPADKEDMPPPNLSKGIRRIDKVTPSTVTIHIPLSTSEFVTGYHVRIKQDIGFSCDEQIQQKQGVKNLDHYFCSAQSYIVAELLKEDVLKNPEFIIGDNKTYGSYYNPPLMHHANYLVYIGLISRISESIYGVSWSDGLAISPESTVTRSCEGSSYFHELIIVAVLLSLLFIAVFIIICTLLIKIRSLKNTNGPIMLQSENRQDDRNFNGAGEVIMSTDGYVEYKVSQQDISTYHNLDDGCVKNQQADDSTYAYVNDSMGEPPNPDTKGAFTL